MNKYCILYERLNIDADELQECVAMDLNNFENRIRNCSECRNDGVANFDASPIIILPLHVQARCTILNWNHTSAFDDRQVRFN